jgi:hypothetical protein
LLAKGKVRGGIGVFGFGLHFNIQTFTHKNETVKGGEAPG